MLVIQSTAILQTVLLLVSACCSALPLSDVTLDNESLSNTTQSNVTSIKPNFSWLYSAMDGYDPARSDPSSNRDPGVRQQIFEPFCQKSCPSCLPSSANHICLEGFVGKAREDHRCSKQFSSQTVTSIEQYKAAVVSSAYQLPTKSIESEQDATEFSFRTFWRDETDEEKVIKSFFEETSGEIILSVSECISHSVAITPYQKPKFTKGFKIAIHSINSVAVDPKSDNSNERVRRFISTYGTHFMQEIKLGSKVIFLVLLKKRSINAEHETKRKNCAEQAARASITRFNSENKETLQDIFSTTWDNCRQEKFPYDSKYTLKVISLGTFPYENTNITSPVPIYFTLEKITSLFKTAWLNDPEPYPTDNDHFDHGFVDGTLLSAFMEEKIRNYCQLVFGIPCPAPKACSLHGNECFALDTCDDSTGAYLCTSRIRNRLHYGGAVTTGGLTTDGPTVRSLAIQTSYPPPLPVAVSSHTLSFVNGVLYSCGGQVQGSGITNICYTLKINDGSETWEDDLRLPKSVSGHTAVVVGEHIWFVADNKLFDLDTNTKHVKCFELHFEVTSGHCAVSNGKHSYIIGVGGGKNQICYNTVAYKPDKWHCSEPLGIGMGNHACVWLDSTVYISGVGTEFYELDTKSPGEVTSKRIEPKYRRSNGKMMVLDRLPTLVGGKDDKDIAQYKIDIEEWSTSKIKIPTAIYSFGLAQFPASADIY